ncbi:MAG TPA: 1-acyl-sn-glycerol-3-phosphate acyltransferase [Thermoanaerobaculia bacterium]
MLPLSTRDTRTPIRSTIALPLWLALLLVLLAAWAALDLLLIPSVRWILRRRVHRVLEELETRLKIRIQPFKLTKREVLIDRLLEDPQVQHAAEALAREDDVPRAAAMARAQRYAREIVPAFNAYLYFRVGYAIARNVARSLYRVRLGYADEEGLAAIAPDSTVVFVMNHRSNMDYVLIGYLAAERTALSYAVGEWARIWPLQTLIRAMGAYFVRRNSRDALYRKVLERYVGMATAAGVTQAVFPEGGLSRDGRLGPPKLGILDYMLRAFETRDMLRAFDPTATRDIVFVPVGINYDRTFEDRSLLLDLDPAVRLTRPSAAGALSTVVRFVGRNAWLRARSRWHRFGYACVNFGSPVSLAAWVRRRGLDLRALSKEEHSRRLEELARELMADVARVIPVVPVALVATVFVREPERRWSELELKGRVLEEIEGLERRGAHVYVPRGDQDYAITVGLRMLTLRHLVEEDSRGLYRAVPEELPLLRYYARSIEHLFG